MTELEASIQAKVGSVLQLANGKVFYLKCEAQKAHYPNFREGDAAL